MIYVEKIKVVNNSYPSNVLDRGLEIECSSINLFVGNQGCGKSSLLNMMMSNHGDLNITLTDHAIQHGVDTFYFNSETDNPRTKDPTLFTTPSGQNIGIGYGGALASRFRSHGEVLSDFIFGPLEKAENCVIFLDEPESGLSLTNQFRLVDTIKTAVTKGCQLFIATHCYLLIKGFDVISLEHKRSMSGKEFIHTIVMEQR